MIRVFDFRCPNGHVKEHFVENEMAVQCLECDQLALRQVAGPRAKLEPFTGAFPGAADKWVRNRESHMKREQHNKREHDSYK